MYCKNCGTEIDENVKVCPNCGTPVEGQRIVGSKSKIAAGLLGIFLGGIGIHKFYLGYKKEGVIMILISIIAGILTLGIAASVMGVIGIIEGIIYLVQDDEAFEQIYVRNHKGWF